MIPIGALGPAMSGLSGMMGSGGLGAAMSGAGGGLGGLMSMMGGGGGGKQTSPEPMKQVDLTKKRQNALNMMEF